MSSPGTRSRRRIRLNYLTGSGLAIVTGFVIIAILAPVISPYDPYAANIPHARAGSSAEHLLGTDELGRDILSRLLYGARLSLLAGFGTVAMAALVGVPLGLLAGYFGGAADTAIMRVMDVLLALPYLLLALAVVAILGPGLTNAMIAIAIWTLPSYARITRAAALSVRQEAYVEAAKAVGQGDVRILLRHVLPNCLSPIIIQSSLRIGAAIVAVAALSFLGFGAQPPTPEWGAMLNSGRAYLRSAPHIVTYPGVAILLVVLGFNLLGDGIRDVVDPRSRRR